MHIKRYNKVYWEQIQIHLEVHDKQPSSFNNARKYCDQNPSILLYLDSHKVKCKANKGKENKKVGTLLEVK